MLWNSFARGPVGPWAKLCESSDFQCYEQKCKSFIVQSPTGPCAKNEEWNLLVILRSNWTFTKEVALGCVCWSSFAPNRYCVDEKHRASFIWKCHSQRCRLWPVRPRAWPLTEDSGSPQSLRAVDAWAHPADASAVMTNTFLHFSLANAKLNNSISLVAFVGTLQVLNDHEQGRDPDPLFEDKETALNPQRCLHQLGSINLTTVYIEGEIFHLTDIEKLACSRPHL